MLPDDAVEDTGSLSRFRAAIREREINDAISELVKLGIDNSMDGRYWRRLYEPARSWSDEEHPDMPKIRERMTEVR